MPVVSVTERFEELGQGQRDELEWWMLRTIRLSWTWVLGACAFIAGVVAFAADLEGLFG